VLRAFFFFAGCDFDVIAHRIVWYEGVANRQTSGRRVDSGDVASRVMLSGAASERGTAMTALQVLMAGACCWPKVPMSKFRVLGVSFSPLSVLGRPNIYTNTHGYNCGVLSSLQTPAALI